MPEQSWLKRLFSSDRRQTPRHKSLPLVAFYWDGAEPVPHGLLDVSLTGLYLLTQQRWYPGTVVTMTLQRARAAATDPERAIAVNARVVRSGKDGVGLEFVPPQTRDPQPNVANSKTIRRFFERAQADSELTG
jgi:hypothetical protein